MKKRYLDLTSSELLSLSRDELLYAIAASEGRVLACETIGATMPVLGEISNAELAAAMGADFLILNLFDVQNPIVNGIPHVEKFEVVRELKRLTGRPIAINLEPVPLDYTPEKTPWALTAGRRATIQNALLARDMGVDMILLTGNPGVGVSNADIAKTLVEFKREIGDDVILAAGKMHAAGILNEGAKGILSTEDIKLFCESGADIILLPAPGTVPAITLDYASKLVEYAHRLGALTITAIGTSQEGADADTIRRIALMCKMCGTDIHHLGDAGYVGMSVPENITAYSIAIRGVRHTYRRMAASIQR
ncbi:MAG: haloacid dehalogenase-like hydrolase [Oscillospiraceae bacterium]